MGDEFVVKRAPIAHRPQHGTQRLAVWREGIFHTGGLLIVDFALDDAVAFQLAQVLREHFMGDAGGEALEFAEAVDAVIEAPQDPRLPFPANHGDSGFHVAKGFGLVLHDYDIKRQSLVGGK